MSIPKTLTTKEVARLCCVSDATVKRWEEAGVLISERTNGGHRRFRVEEVARFQRDTGLGAKLRHGEESAVKTARQKASRQGSFSSSLYHCMLSGNEEDTANMLVNAYLSGHSLASIFDGLVAETMHRIGDSWYAGEISVAQEHLATRTLVAGIQKLRSLAEVPASKGFLALICAVEGDFHELPVNLAQIALEGCGWEVMNFGANTPLYSFAEQVLKHSPEMVCLSSTIIFDLERNSRDFREFLDKIAPVGAQVCIGGQAFTEARSRSRFPADIYAQTFADVVNAAERIADSRKEAFS